VAFTLAGDVTLTMVFSEVFTGITFTKADTFPVTEAALNIKELNSYCSTEIPQHLV